MNIIKYETEYIIKNKWDMVIDRTQWSLYWTRTSLWATKHITKDEIYGKIQVREHYAELMTDDKFKDTGLVIVKTTVEHIKPTEQELLRFLEVNKINKLGFYK